MKCVVGSQLVLSRTPEGPLAPYLGAFGEYLGGQGYALSSIHRQVLLAACFSRWLKRKRAESRCINSDHPEQYLRYRARQVKLRPGDAAALGHFIDFLRSESLIAAETVTVPRLTPVEHCAQAYAHHLGEAQALAEATIINYVPFVQSFLKGCFGDGPVALSDLSARDGVTFVQRQAPRLSMKRAKLMTSALRSFLNYARYRGEVVLDLAAAVPVVPNWSMPSIPRAISADQVQQLLASIDRHSATGRRDYAILLLLARLGLRSGEVAFLELDDIDWNAGTVSVHGKGPRKAFPLPLEGGHAIAAYLQGGRPLSVSRRVFLRVKAPIHGFRGASGAGGWNGGRAPLGYQVGRDPNHPRRKRLEPNPEEAPMVLQVFRWRVEGYGAKSIAMMLRERGFANRGLQWNKSSVSCLLRNQAAAGRIVFGRRSRPDRRKRPRSEWILVDSHPPIVPLELFDHVQKMMDGATNTRDGSPHSTRLFTGILHCSETGSSMQIESGKGRSQRYYYYGCRSAQRTGLGQTRRIRADLFDQWMVSQILDEILTPVFLEGLAREIIDSEAIWERQRQKRRSEAQAVLRQVTERNRKLYEIMETYGKDTPNLADLTRRLRENNEKIRELEQRIAAIDAEQRPEIDLRPEDVSEIATTVRYLIETTDNPMKLRHFFASFIEKIWLEGSSVRIEYRPEILMRSKRIKVVPSNADWYRGSDSNRHDVTIGGF